MLPLGTEPIEAEMPTTSEDTDLLHESPKAATEAAEQDPTVNTRVEARLTGGTSITGVDTTTFDKRMSPRTSVRPTEKKNEETSEIQRKKQQPSSENILLALTKSAFPKISLKMPAKSVKSDKSTEQEAETNPLTEGEKAFEEILSALGKSKSREEARKKNKGKDKA